MKLYEYTAIWSPTEKQAEDGQKPKLIITDIGRVLAETDDQAKVVAARAIPDEYVDQLEQVTLVVRPF